MYSELYTQSHFRFTKYLAFAALFVVVSTVIFLLSQDSSPTRASKRTLKEHEVVNVSPRQIGVFWETDEPDEGWIMYGENDSSLDLIALDERDIKSEKTKRKYHYALLKNLQPDKVYYYKIVSNNELISHEDGGAFESMTLEESAAMTSLSPIYGKVIQTNGQPAKSAYAMLIVGNAYPLMTMTGNTGEWLIPLQYLANKQTRSSVPVTDDALITIQLFDDENRSMVRSTINRSRPIPQPITLGNNYSFIAETDVLAVQNTNKKSEVPVRRDIVDIRFPKQGAVIPGVAPLIKGYGIPGKAAEVTIDSKPEFSSRVIVDEKGEWNVPVKTSIKPGKYTLTVQTEDAKGDIVQLEREFTLIKSGERVLGESDEATPSGSITPSTAPTVIVSTATPTPTTVRSPTPSGILASPTPIISGTLTGVPTPPVSGMSIIPMMMAGVGMIAFGIGVMLLL
ncbi:hypothetical protein IPM65_07355 [Candidatus Roizmanbacteria bacterium]|nr:MAG: hypothetical protein IPM65_07355 [Candidatus Roizmanbacteria bacterium]